MVDSFKFLPRIIAYYYQKTARRSERKIPWSPMQKPISACRFGLVTSGGLFDSQRDRPFDVEREKLEPTWGDPTFRVIGANIKSENIGASHLHYNTTDVLSDFNILLPMQRFQELEQENVIGSVAKSGYSFMGYQGFPPNTTQWVEKYGPKVVAEFLKEGVDCIFLTPA